MSKIDKIRLGVIGLGRGLQSVLDIIIDDDVDLIAICDKNPEMVEKAKAKLKEEFGIEELGEDEASGITTVGDLVRLLHSHID